MGQIVGKALFDFAPVNFPVNKLLLKFMINKNYKPTLEDLKEFDS